ncbi:MAG: VOC family protein [Chloroflexota bacterium]
MPVEYKPAQYHTVTPYLVVDGAEQIISFIVDVLDGTETMRMPGPDGRIAHAEMRVGDSMIMLADAPEASEVTSTTLHLYVPDSDATYRRALDAGATSLREPRDEFYGDRMSGVQDGTGNKWYFATHVEDLSGEEMARRATEAAQVASI